MFELKELLDFCNGYDIDKVSENPSTGKDVLLNSTILKDFFKNNDYSFINDTKNNDILNSLKRNIYFKEFKQLVIKCIQSTGTNKYHELIDILYYKYKDDLTPTEYIVENPDIVNRPETRVTWLVYQNVKNDALFKDSKGKNTVGFTCQVNLDNRISSYDNNSLLVKRPFDMSFKYIKNDEYDAPPSENSKSVFRIDNIKLLVEVQEAPGNHNKNIKDMEKLELAKFHRHQVCYWPSYELDTVEKCETMWQKCRSMILQQFVCRSVHVRTMYFRMRVQEEVKKQIQRWDEQLVEFEGDEESTKLVQAGKDMDVEALENMTSDIMNRLFSFKDSKVISFDDFAYGILRLNDSDTDIIDLVKKIMKTQLPIGNNPNYDLSWENAVELLLLVKDHDIVFENLRYSLNLAFKYAPGVYEEMIEMLIDIVIYSVGDDRSKQSLELIIPLIRNKDYVKNFLVDKNEKVVIEYYKKHFKVDDMVERITKLERGIVENFLSRKPASKNQIILQGWGNFIKICKEVIDKKTFISMFRDDFTIKVDIPVKKEETPIIAIKEAEPIISIIDDIDDFEES